MRLPEKCFEWQAGAWKFGATLCPGTWAVIIWWDGNPYSLAIVLPFVRFWCERDGGKHWPCHWTILRLVVGKQEFRFDLALNQFEYLAWRQKWSEKASREFVPRKRRVGDRRTINVCGVATNGGQSRGNGGREIGTENWAPTKAILGAAPAGRHRQSQAEGSYKGRVWSARRTLERDRVAQG